MLISELPPDIRDVAIRRMEEFNRRGRDILDRYHIPDELSAAFIWDETSEGHSYWSSLDSQYVTYTQTDDQIIF